MEGTYSHRHLGGLIFHSPSRIGRRPSSAYHMGRSARCKGKEATHCTIQLSSTTSAVHRQEDEIGANTVSPPRAEEGS